MDDFSNKAHRDRDTDNWNSIGSIPIEKGGLIAEDSFDVEASDSGSIRINANKRKELPLRQYKAPLQLTPPNLDEIIVNIIIVEWEQRMMNLSSQGQVKCEELILAELLLVVALQTLPHSIVSQVRHLQRDPAVTRTWDLPNIWRESMMTDQINSTRESFVKLRLSTNSQTQTLNYLNQHYEREKENPICGQKVGQDPEDDSQILAHTSIWFVEPEHFKKYDPNHKGYTKEIVLNHDLSAIKTLPAGAEKFIFQYGGKPIDLLALNLKWGHRDFTDESTEGFKGLEQDKESTRIKDRRAEGLPERKEAGQIVDSKSNNINNNKKKINKEENSKNNKEKKKKENNNNIKKK
ncbi:hypothetical protein BY996DRAFT_6493676 [Phakopsora pachyrhizi]|nr:hypothetical protein BY996DRAFT_6493676 [Phakopsora pachyrhizi]